MQTPSTITGPSGRTASGRARDARIAAAIEAWFDAHARDLPWRRVGPDGRRDPYRSVVSEFMLQQTQVSRVVPAFERFVGRFPDVRALAAAPVEDVMRLWEGLGYYRRAGLLHRAAREIVDRHGGVVPGDAATLREIPGVGAYTAGSVASIVFGVRTPIVDANVRRVVMRIDGRDRAETEAERTAWVWKRAGELVQRADRPGVFNEGIMELGALHCLPRGPVCAGCPAASACRARARGAQDRIPGAGKRPDRAEVVHQVVVVRDRAGRVLVEQRPKGGMWAGLWQFPTWEGPGPGLDEGGLRAWAGVGRLEEVWSFTRMTTHRAVRFRVWRAVGAVRLARGGRRWVRADAAAEVAFSVPHRLILERCVDGAGGGGVARAQT